MMRIAIAGSNGFAQYLAHYLESTTAHQFFLLSRKPSPGLAAKGWQIIQSSYDSLIDLTYLLTGVDIVISTISGNSQLLLIDAAVAAKIRYFVPSEFRSSPALRAKDDPTDNGRAAALARLQQVASYSKISYTVFTCGLFYERFAPGGLAASQISVDSAFGGEGDYLVDVRKCLATVPTLSTLSTIPTPQQEACISITSARDAARYVVAALSLREWPRELIFCAQRISIRELIVTCEKIRGLPFRIQTYTPSSLQQPISYSRAMTEKATEIRLTQQLYTAEGRFDFTHTNLDSMVNIHCETFEEWLTAAWSSVL